MKKTIKWIIFIALGIWASISFIVIAGEEAPDVHLSTGQFMLIKFIAFGSFIGCVLTGKWLYKKGFLPDCIDKEI